MKKFQDNYFTGYMKTEYDILAKIYDPALYFFLNPVRKEVMRILNDFKDRSILDLCCGTGSQVKLLAKHGFSNLHCLDLSSSMLKIAQKGNANIKIYNQDATGTSFNNESFDLVIISFAVHEKDRATQEKMLEEAYRITKESGYMLIVDYEFDKNTSVFSRKAISMVERIAGKEHYNNFKEYIKNNGLNGLIKKDKFKLVKVDKKILNGVTISMYRKLHS